MILHTMALLASAFIGHHIGRTSPGDRLLAWAERSHDTEPRTWRFWIAPVIFLTALAWLWITHPRRTRDNIRSWRQADDTP
jgi:hypothetical protein